MTAPAGDILLRLAGLTKTYPGVTALSGVDLELRRAQVHALVGENGAGKSTLSKIVVGLERADSGSMFLAGRGYRPSGKADAERRGVRIVMQELNLIPTLTVAENIFLEDMPRRFGWINYPAMNAAAAGLLAEVGLNDVRPDCPVGRLGVAQQQMVEIAAGLSRRCDLLILDEPTASLSDSERQRLFAHLDRLKAAGAAVLYISHRLEEIQRISDRITVLRDGKVVASAQTSQTDIAQIIRWMVGRELKEFQTARRAPGPVLLSVRHLRRPPAVLDVSFDLHQGEILGFAGLMGAGRTETMRAIFGADEPRGGEIRLGGSNRPVRIASPRQAVRLGIALLTENRKEQGLVLPMPVRANITLANLRALAWPGGWVRRSREHATAQRFREALRIRCHSTEQTTGTLSGGNQQKVVVAKWLCRDCDVLIFDEPTRGIDVGSKFEVYQLLADLAGRGKGIIVVSSDMQELLNLCDRIAVMSAGRLVEIFERGQWTQDKIMSAALSGYAEAAQAQ